MFFVHKLLQIQSCQYELCYLHLSSKTNLCLSFVRVWHMGVYPDTRPPTVTDDLSFITELALGGWWTWLSGLFSSIGLSISNWHFLEKWAPHWCVRRRFYCMLHMKRKGLKRREKYVVVAGQNDLNQVNVMIQIHPYITVRRFVYFLYVCSD